MLFLPFKIEMRHSVKLSSKNRLINPPKLGIQLFDETIMGEASAVLSKEAVLCLAWRFWKGRQPAGAILPSP